MRPPKAPTVPAALENDIQTQDKRKRVSKKGKKNWRKNVDISDVEKVLEKQRADEQQGGAVEEKANYELFFVDKVPSLPCRKSSRQTKKEAARAKSSWDKRLTVNTSKIQVQRSRTSSSKIKGDMNKKAIHHNIPHNANSQQKEDEDMVEVWSGKEQEPKNEYVAVVTAPVPHRPKLPARKSKTLVVEVAEPGASYNPSYDDHQKLMRKAVGEEQTKVDADLKLRRELYANVDKSGKPFVHGVDDVPTDEPSDEDDDTRDGGVTEEGDSAEARVAPRPRTKKERRRQKAHQEKILAGQMKKVQRQREAEVHRIKTLKKEITAEDGRRAAAKAHKETMDEKLNDGILNLGRHNVKKLNIDIKLTDELVGSLRELKPEGSLVRERFTNFQKRNIIAPRRLQSSKQKKTFEFTKKDFKASKLPFFGGEVASEV